MSNEFIWNIGSTTDKVMDIINAYGMVLNPQDDIQFKEAAEIIKNSNTSMELVGNGYIYGYFMGKKTSQKRNIPILNIPMMSDERWNELAVRCQKGGVAS